MIISRTPFRISFFGGGTDYPAWYDEQEGAVLSTTIDKYCYITCRYLPPFFDFKYRIVYSEREAVNNLSDIRHPSVRECLDFMKLDRGVEIHYDGDLPARTGIGSSSSFTVGLLNALYALKGKMVTKKKLALDAIYIEQEKIREHVGSQDQTIAAFGGFNKIIFTKNHNIEVQPITATSEKLQCFQQHLMLFFTGFSRLASDIAEEQIKGIPNKKNELKTMRQLVDAAIDILDSNDNNFDDFGRLLHESWKIKRSLTSRISTPLIDRIYQVARDSGAIGGKLLGAGGGGFILFFVRPESQHKVRMALKELLYVPFRFDTLGSQIIYYAPDHSSWWEFCKDISDDKEYIREPEIEPMVKDPSQLSIELHE